MKLLLLLLLTCSLSYGQDYRSLVAEASGFYTNKEFDKSTDKYREAFKLKQSDAGDLYNAACSASLAGNKKQAFEWLNLALKNGWTNARHTKSDTDLVALHDSKRWTELINAMQKELDQKEANYDKPLQARLLAIFDEDQQIRQQYIAALKDHGHGSRQVDSLGNIMMHIDSINLDKIVDILDHDGWVGPDQVGSQASQTLFLVIQHSDLKTQQKYLPMMREAVQKGNATGRSLALLEDRVALGEGRRQTYGSQIGYDNETQKYYVLPLDDPDHVNERREKMGLGSLSDYVKQWDITWNADEYKKLLPAIEAKQR